MQFVEDLLGFTRPTGHGVRVRAIGFGLWTVAQLDGSLKLCDRLVVRARQGKCQSKVVVSNPEVRVQGERLAVFFYRFTIPSGQMQDLADV